MKIHWSHYLDHQRWIPMLVVLVIGLVGGFAINMAFGDELEMLGVIIACMLGGVFLCLLGLVFYVLRQIQQRARWEKESFQMLVRARLDADHEAQVHIHATQAEERRVFLAIVEAVFVGAPNKRPANGETLKALEQAMALATDMEMPLTMKLTELQALVDRLESR